MRHLARRWIALSQEVNAIAAELEELVQAAAPPALLEEFGVGVDVASALLVTAGDNPERMSSEQSFAALCGASPLDASSGRQQRHRLNRGGDRTANSALWRIVIVRLQRHQPTKDYLARRVAEGKTKREVIRCIKRYLARRIWRILQHHQQFKILAPAA